MTNIKDVEKRKQLTAGWAEWKSESSIIRASVSLCTSDRHRRQHHVYLLRKSRQFGKPNNVIRRSFYSTIGFPWSHMKKKLLLSVPRRPISIRDDNPGDYPESACMALRPHAERAAVAEEPRPQWSSASFHRAGNGQKVRVRFLSYPNSSWCLKASCDTKFSDPIGEDLKTVKTLDQHMNCRLTAISNSQLFQLNPMYNLKKKTEVTSMDTWAEKEKPEKSKSIAGKPSWISYKLIFL